jgi:hypothetical protein
LLADSPEASLVYENISRYGDVPGTKVPREQKSRIMHAVLRIGEGVVMVSDATPDRAIAVDGKVQIALHFTEPAEMAKAFEALAAGGEGHASYSRHVLGREVWHADGCLRGSLDVQLRAREDLKTTLNWRSVQKVAS